MSSVSTYIVEKGQTQNFETVTFNNETFFKVVYSTHICIYIFILDIIYWGGHMLQKPPIMPLKGQSRNSRQDNAPYLENLDAKQEIT